jgi:hypothetical protein
MYVYIKVWLIWSLCVFGIQFVLLGTLLTNGSKMVFNHGRLHMNLTGHTLMGLEQLHR